MCKCGVRHRDNYRDGAETLSTGADATLSCRKRGPACEHDVTTGMTGAAPDFVVGTNPSCRVVLPNGELIRERRPPGGTIDL
jgi:hypothetical protein